MIDRDVLLVALERGLYFRGHRDENGVVSVEVDFKSGLRAILRALDTAGYCIVPKEASLDMKDAAGEAIRVGTGPIVLDIWQAMVAKAQEGGA